MLGYFFGGDGADAILASLAAELSGGGLRLAGAIQVNSTDGTGGRRAMDLRLLSGGAMVRISQMPGPMSRGCRLDPDGLETAAGLVEAALAAPAPPALLIVNKFGKQEALGRGFRCATAKALLVGIPVLISVAASQRAAFAEFAGEIGTALAAEHAALREWCLRVAAPQ